MPTNGTFSLSPTPLDIKIYYSHLASNSTVANYEGLPGNPSDLVQEITVTFRASVIFVFPSCRPRRPHLGLHAFTDLSGRLYSGNFGAGDSGGSDMPIMPGDTVRSLVVGYNGICEWWPDRAASRRRYHECGVRIYAISRMERHHPDAPVATRRVQERQRDDFSDDGFKPAAY